MISSSRQLKDKVRNISDGNSTYVICHMLQSIDGKISGKSIYIVISR